MFIEYKIPDFTNFENDFSRLLIQNEKEIESLLRNHNKTYDNFIKPLQYLEEKLNLFFTPLANENGVNATKEVQEAYTKAIPLISKYYSKLTQNEKLFQALELIHSQKDITPIRKHLLMLEIKEFVLAGAKLKHDEKKEIEKIDLRLSQLSNEFSKNLLEATDAYELEVTLEDLGDMPQEDIQTFLNDEGKYIVTLQMPSYIAFMTYSPNRALRQEVYKAYNTRAPQNAMIIDEILQLRYDKAKLIGFENYSAYSVESKTAHSVEEVNIFLEKLAQSAIEKAKEELQELQEYAGMQLESYDFGYYSERYKKEKFDFNEEEIKPYFEQNRVVEGLFALVGELFGLEFKKIDVPSWHEKVQVYEVNDEGNVSRLYLDLESRKNKRSGAWMSDFQTRFLDIDGTVNPASAFIVCNFASSDKAPSLLRHDDVVTLFHEMGHALHHVLSKVDERNVSGINGVAWDVVEFPSQFLENFAYEPWVLQRFAKHYKTGETIAPHYLQKIKDAKNYQAAIGLMRQLEFSLFDFWLHQDMYQGEEVQELLNKIRSRYSVIRPPEYNKFQNGFSHIFAGGYSAGYYSYKWAEVMSADAFFECVKDEQIDSQKALGYKQNILHSGASENMSTLYRQWLHKDFAVDSLLKLYGLK
jgi:oligopeptidase A